MVRWQFIGAIASLSIFVSSCARIPKGSEEQVAGIVQQRIGKEVIWNHGCYEDPCILTYIKDLLSQPITIESAIQIALLNNPEVQAIFSRLYGFNEYQWDGRNV